MKKSSFRRMRRGFTAGVAALAVGAMLAACGTGGGDADNDDPIRIAGFFPTSGSLALLGEESWRGVQIAVDEVNADGGIAGRDVEVVKADVPDVNSATSESRRLLDSEDLQLAVGTYSSALALAASEVYARGGGTYVELGAVSMDFNTRGYKNVLRTNPNADHMADAQIDLVENWAADALGKKKEDLKILVVHEDSSYGSSLSRSFKEKAAAEGMENVSESPYSAESTDLSSTVLQIGKADPDVVIAVSYASDAILLGRQMAENSVTVPVFIGSGGGHTLDEFGKTLGDKANYVFDADFTQFDVNPDQTPGLEEFVEAYKKKFGEDPASGHSLANYAGMQAVFKMLEATDGDVSSDKVLEAAKAIDEPEGTTAAGWGIKFDKKGQNERAEDYVTQWVDGELKTVWPESVATTEPQLAK
jgi:branched-chain amino acid transport system substrate-binding protein